MPQRRKSVWSPSRTLGFLAVRARSTKIAADAGFLLLRGSVEIGHSQRSQLAFELPNSSVSICNQRARLRHVLGKPCAGDRNWNCQPRNIHMPYGHRRLSLRIEELSVCVESRAHLKSLNLPPSQNWEFTGGVPRRRTYLQTIINAEFPSYRLAHHPRDL